MAACARSTASCCQSRLRRGELALRRVEILGDVVSTTSRVWMPSTPSTAPRTTTTVRNDAARTLTTKRGACPRRARAGRARRACRSLPIESVRTMGDSPIGPWAEALQWPRTRLHTPARTDVNVSDHAARRSRRTAIVRAENASGSKSVPMWRESSLSASSGGVRRGRRAGAGHRVVGVGDVDDARGERDVVAAQSVRVAAAVGPLVVQLDDRDVRRAGTAPAARMRAPSTGCCLMTSNSSSVSGPRLAQDVVRHANLADVVQQRARAAARRARRPAGAWPADGDREHADALGVAGGVGIARVERRGQGADGAEVGGAGLGARLVHGLEQRENEAPSASSSWIDCARHARPAPHRSSRPSRGCRARRGRSARRRAGQRDAGHQAQDADRRRRSTNSVGTAAAVARSRAAVIDATA